MSHDLTWKGKKKQREQVERFRLRVWVGGRVKIGDRFQKNNSCIHVYAIHLMLCVIINTQSLISELHPTKQIH